MPTRMRCTSPRATRRIALGRAAPRESYLDGARILAIARRRGAQAIHPGLRLPVGERGIRRARARRAGIVFIGPPPAAIAAMGSKSAAKRIMAKAGVPLVPGYHGDDQDPALLAREAAAIGYPVLIKATAGGGGKGMKIVDAAQRVRRGARIGAARGAGRLRRRSRAGRALPDVAAAHRDPGVRRHARQRRSTCSSATARCSGGTRRCWRKRRRRA